MLSYTIRNRHKTLVTSALDALGVKYTCNGQEIKDGEDFSLAEILTVLYSDDDTYTLQDAKVTLQEKNLTVQTDLDPEKFDKLYTEIIEKHGF